MKVKIANPELKALLDTSINRLQKMHIPVTLSVQGTIQLNEETKHGVIRLLSQWLMPIHKCKEMNITLKALAIGCEIEVSQRIKGASFKSMEIYQRADASTNTYIRTMREV